MLVAMRFSHGLIRHFPIMGIQALRQVQILLECFFPTKISDLQREWKRDICQCIGRRNRYGTWHVCDTIENRIVNTISWVFMGGCPRIFETSTLVNRDIDQNRSGLHLGNILIGDQFWRPRAGDQNRTDHQVRRVARAAYAIHGRGIAGVGFRVV